MNSIPVIVATVAILDPRFLPVAQGLKPNVLYTYYRSITREGKCYVFIDQVRQWYYKDYFIDQDILLN